MHFSQRAIEMAWAQCAQPLFHKEEAIARKALEEGDGTKVSQLFIFMHIDVGGLGRGGREFVRGEEADLQDKAETHLSWSATADGTFKVVVGSMPPLAPSPWSTTPYPVVIVVVRVAVRGNLQGVLHHQSIRGHPPGTSEWGGRHPNP